MDGPGMPLIRSVHHAQVHGRRVTVLAGHLAGLMPSAASVLDIGTGDGLLARRVLAHRRDLQWTAVDTLPRPQAYVPVKIFDGRQLPFPDKTFDVALFVDVLHHADDPMALLREAVRVTRGSLLIKDHLREGVLAGPTLRFMDWIGNASWGVQLPYNYWDAGQWEAACQQLHLRPAHVRRALGLYPWWADWCFGRSLHFISKLDLPEH